MKKTELTFRHIRNYQNSVVKLMESNEIQNFEDAILIASMRKSFEEVLEAFSKGNNAVAFKYAKLAEKREITEKESVELGCKSILGGYNSVAEQESRESEMELFLNKPITPSMEFPVLKTDTVKKLYKVVKKDNDKDSENKKEEKVFTMNDLGAYISLGLIDTESE